MIRPAIFFSRMVPRYIGAPHGHGQHLCHRLPSVAGSGFSGTGTPACATSHSLLMRAFSTASGFLSITVKQARTALSGGLRPCSHPWSERGLCAARC